MAGGETPLDEERGRMLRLRLQARQAVAQAQEEGRLGRQLARDHEENEETGRRSHGALFRGTARSRPTRSQPTPRELEVVTALSHGLRSGEIADLLNLSPWTITDLIKHARAVTASKTKEHLVANCIRQGWVT